MTEISILDMIGEPAMCKEKVIAVYPRFVQTRLCSRNGRQACEESFMWDDVAKWNKFLWEV